MTTETNIGESNPDLFKEEDIYQFEDASTGQRFLNLLIDTIFMNFGLGLLTIIILENILLAVSPETLSLFDESRGTFDAILANYLLSILNYLIYYTICEKAFKGYTLGKLVTGTRAIRDDGKELTFKDAFLRSLSRLVPFEAFSALGGHPWHDNWTNTRVIKSR